MLHPSRGIATFNMLKALPVIVITGSALQRYIERANNETGLWCKPSEQLQVWTFYQGSCDESYALELSSQDDSIPPYGRK